MSRPTRSFNRRRLLVGGLAFFLMAAPAVSAFAQGRPLDAPRAQGLVGERYDGMLVLRNANAPAAVKQLVSQTNAKRLALYKKRAKETGASVRDVGMIYANQIAKDAPKGTYFLTEGGKWVRR
ncbi:MAG: YdbL family protein [Alphaproteobacteria bacterium]|nr:YdbL family protein [Alphaproteobacteria bacterium]